MKRAPYNETSPSANPHSRDSSHQAHPSIKYVRRCPTLPHPYECSTIGAGRLSFRVRNGTGRTPTAITTETLRNNTTVAPHTTKPVRELVWCFRIVEWVRSIFVGKSSAD